MVTWRPIHANHAIERARVTLGFDQSPPDKLVSRVAQALSARSSELQLAGPGVQSATFLAPGGPPLVFQGWSFTRSTSSGQLVELVNLMPTELAYEVGEYVRWEPFLQRLQTVLQPVIEDLFGVLTLRATTIEYLDRFVFRGPVVEALPTTLLAPELVATLSESVREGGKLWHLHRGWFQGVDGHDVLINVNLEAQDGDAGGEAARSVAMLTKAILAHPDGRDGVETLYSDLDFMHDILIDEFSRCLLPAARGSVGLELT